MRKPDRTELFNLLTIIAGLILGGGSSLPLEIMQDVPKWAMPILLIVAVAVNIASRDQVKSQKDLSEYMQGRQGTFEEHEAIAGSYPGDGKEDANGG